MKTYEGVQVRIGERELVMPALPPGELLAHFKIIGPLVQQAMKDDTATAALLEAELAMVHSALVRNHPELTLEELENALGQFQIVELFDRLCRHSGGVGGAMVRAAAQRTKARM